MMNVRLKGTPSRVCVVLLFGLICLNPGGWAKSAARKAPPKPGSFVQRIGLGGPPSHVEPELRAFVASTAIKVRDAWRAAKKPTFLPVYVSFYRDGEDVYINGSEDDDEAGKATAEKLVRHALKGVHAPKGKIYNGYAVTYFFESYPDKSNPDPRLGENFKKQTYDPSNLYTQLLVWRVESKWTTNLAPPKVDCDSIVRITVKQNGELESAILKSSGGNSGYDQSELDAVKASFPFLPLPPGYPPKAQFDLLFSYEQPYSSGNAVDLNFDVSLAEPDDVRTQELHYNKKKQ
jgi:hypothetical protein